jgi:hypothetical protein
MGDGGSLGADSVQEFVKLAEGARQALEGLRGRRGRVGISMHVTQQEAQAKAQHQIFRYLSHENLLDVE